MKYFKDASIQKKEAFCHSTNAMDRNLCFILVEEERRVSHNSTQGLFTHLVKLLIVQ